MYNNVTRKSCVQEIITNKCIAMHNYKLNFFALYFSALLMKFFNSSIKLR